MTDDTPPDPYRAAFAEAFMRHPTGRMNDAEVIAVLATLDARPSGDAYRAGYSDGLNAKLDTLPVRPSGDEALRAAAQRFLAARDALLGYYGGSDEEYQDQLDREDSEAIAALRAALAAPVSPSPDTKETL